MHFRVTKGERMTDKDIYYQPDFVSGYIKSGSRVLELGFGQGANLRYLAKKHPDASFVGVDYLPAENDDFPSNVELIKADYSDLSMLKDGSFDVIFAVETIVYNTNKTSVFSEVRRLLSPDGVFIIYDYVLEKPFETYGPTDQDAISLISKCGASAMIETQEKWEEYLDVCGIRCEQINDISKETLPDLKRLALKAAGVLEGRPRAAKAMFMLSPRHFTNNVIIGYLGYDACRDGIMGYREWVCRPIDR